MNQEDKNNLKLDPEIIINDFFIDEDENIIITSFDFYEIGVTNEF